MKWSELRWGEVRWGEVRWGEVRWGEVRWGEVRWGEVRWGEVRWGEVKWGEVRWWGEVKYAFKKIATKSVFHSPELARHLSVLLGHCPLRSLPTSFAPLPVGLAPPMQENLLIPEKGDQSSVDTGNALKNGDLWGASRNKSKWKHAKWLAVKKMK